METFNTILIEGLFYRDPLGGQLLSKSSRGIVVVEEVLGQLLDHEIQLAMHHLPEIPLIPDLWGGGCCMWQASGKCPAGHHENPGFLLSLAGRGVLQHREDGWHLATFDGEDLSIPLHQMEGHIGRIAAVPIIDLEKMKESLSSADLEKTALIGIQAKQLQGILCQLQETLKGIK